MLLSKVKPTTDSFQAAKSAPDGTEGWYELFLADVHDSFSSIPKNEQLYRTSVQGLAERYLSLVPASNRQHYNCHACFYFLKVFGGLVYIKEVDGKITTVPAFWSSTKRSVSESSARASASYAVIRGLFSEVKKAKITTVFFPTQRIFGTDDEWRHITADCSSRKLFDSKEVGPKMAEILQDKRMLIEIFDVYKPQNAAEAINKLTASGLTYGIHAQTAANIQWIKNFLEGAAVARKGGSDQFDLYMWDAAAHTPAGYCNVNSTLAGEYLRSVAFSDRDALNKYLAKADPTKYRMAIAPPKEGLLEEGEKYFTDNNLERSLARRIALKSELASFSFWSPQATSDDAVVHSPVFGNVTVKRPGSDKSAGERVKIGNITWTLFKRTVLPKSQQLLYVVPPVVDMAAITTAVHKDAPYLFVWDNALSWYTYGEPVPCTAWGLSAGTRTEICGACDPPYARKLSPQDSERHEQRYGKRAFLFIRGAYNNANPGTAIFEHHLKPEIAKYGRAISERNRNASMSPSSFGQQAVGVMLTQAPFIPVTLVARIGNGNYEYTIDRWE